MRVAVIQNQLSVDGRSHVVGEMVLALNARGITPDVFTLATDANVARWRRSQSGGTPLDCRVVRPFTVPFFGGYVYQTVLHNAVSSRRLRRYDLVINSNDFVGFLPAPPRRLHYIHFPLSQVFAQAERYRQWKWKLFGLPVRLVTAAFEGRILPGDIVCTNSAYSREWIARQWPGAEVVVLPPPVEVPLTAPPREGRDIDVLSVGAITPDKDQLLQLRVAAQLRHRRFVLMGYVSSAKYHALLEETIARLGLTNVTLITDASREVIQAHQRRARVFLHSKQSEHFGISIAEAVGQGCIPVVHDSGGQREIVTDATLRYGTEAEAAQAIERLLGGAPYPEARYAGLLEHVRQYRPEVFRERVVALLRAAGLP